MGSETPQLLNKKTKTSPPCLLKKYACNTCYTVISAPYLTGLICLLVKKMAQCLPASPPLKHAPCCNANAACAALKPLLIKILVPITARLKRFAISTHY